MPRNKQPIELAALKGDVKKNPQRYRNRITKVEIFLKKGEYPESALLTEEEKNSWDFLVGICFPGLLTITDAPWLILTCELWAESRKTKGKFPVSRLNALKDCFNKLGFNPIERQKLAAMPLPKENEFDEFDTQ